MNEYSNQDHELLLNLAKQSIKYGLQHNKVMPINLNDYAAHLLQNRACFVTLNIDGKLRGCIGSLMAYQPLVQDLIHNAYAAAFGDPRFPPLTADEFPQLTIHISILSIPVPMNFSSEQDLLQQLRPGIDGLIMSDKGHRGTFLPSVWDELATPELFLNHLKLKAGLPQDYWSDTLTVERYTTEYFPD